MKCIKCKKEIPENSKFCNHCGAKQHRQSKKRKDGRFEKKITINGKRKSFYAKSQKELNQKILNYKEELKNEKENIPMIKVVEEWENYKYPSLEHNSIEGYKSKANRVKNFFGSMSVNKIGYKDVMEYASELSTSYCQNTIRGYMTNLSNIFKFAMRMGYIIQNPCDFVDMPQGKKTTPRKGPTEEEIKIICDNIDKKGGFLAYFVLYTGLRRNEALVLRWEDIDFKNKIINVTKSLNWHSNVPHIKYPKTDKGLRQVVLLDCLEKELLKRKGRKKDLLFPDDEGKLYTSSRYKKMFNEYKKATGLTITLHNLRHGYATMLEEVNVGFKARQSLLGHAKISTTLDVYTDMTQRQKDKTRQELNNYLSGVKMSSKDPESQ